MNRTHFLTFGLATGKTITVRREGEVAELGTIADPVALGEKLARRGAATSTSTASSDP